MKYFILVLGFVGTQYGYAQSFDLARLFSSPAMEEICAGVVTPHSSNPNVWHLKRPAFAVAETNLYSTHTIGGQSSVVRINGVGAENFQEVIRFDEPIRDLSFANGRLWVLFSESLVVIDTSRGMPVATLPTHELAELPSRHYRAHGIAVIGDQIVVAHGALGISVFDMRTMTFVGSHSLGLREQANGHRSKATAIARSDQGEAVVTVEGVTISNQPGSRAFNGLMKLNLNQANPVVSASAYDYRRSGLLANARVQVYDGMVYLNNSGMLHAVPLEEIDGSRLKIRYIPVNVDYIDVHTVMMGDNLVEKGTLYGCAMITYYESEMSRPKREGISLGVSL